MLGPVHRPDIEGCVPGANFFIPSQASSSIASVDIVGFSHIVLAEWLTRAQWRSRSGATPSKARAPSNTLEAEPEGVVARPEDRRIALDPAALVVGERLRPIGHERLASASALRTGRPDNAPGRASDKGACRRTGQLGAPNEETEGAAALAAFDQRVAARLAIGGEVDRAQRIVGEDFERALRRQRAQRLLARRTGRGQWRPRRSSVTSAKQAPSSNEGEDGARRRRRVGRVAEIGEPIFGGGRAARAANARAKGRRSARRRQPGGSGRERRSRAPPGPPRRTGRRPAPGRRRAAARRADRRRARRPQPRWPRR